MIRGVRQEKFDGTLMDVDHQWDGKSAYASFDMELDPRK